MTIRNLNFARKHQSSSPKCADLLASRSRALPFSLVCPRSARRTFLKVIRNIHGYRYTAPDRSDAEQTLVLCKSSIVFQDFHVRVVAQTSAPREAPGTITWRPERAIVVDSPVISCATAPRCVRRSRNTTTDGSATEDTEEVPVNAISVATAHACAEVAVGTEQCRLRGPREERKAERPLKASAGLEAFAVDEKGNRVVSGPVGGFRANTRPAVLIELVVEGKNPKFTRTLTDSGSGCCCMSRTEAESLGLPMIPLNETRDSSLPW